jgi:hypothetical protein
VLLLNPGAGGVLPVSTSWGAVLQVPTHFATEPDLPFAPVSQAEEVRNTIAILTTRARNLQEDHNCPTPEVLFMAAS